MVDFNRLTTRTDIASGSRHLVEASKKLVAFFKCDGQFFAVDDSCHLPSRPREGFKKRFRPVTPKVIDVRNHASGNQPYHRPSDA